MCSCEYLNSYIFSVISVCCAVCCALSVALLQNIALHWLCSFLLATLFWPSILPGFFWFPGCRYWGRPSSLARPTTKYINCIIMTHFWCCQTDFGMRAPAMPLLTVTSTTQELCSCRLVHACHAYVYLLILPIYNLVMDTILDIVFTQTVPISVTFCSTYKFMMDLSVSKLYMYFSVLFKKKIFFRFFFFVWPRGDYVPVTRHILVFLIDYFVFFQVFTYSLAIWSFHLLFWLRL